MQTLEMTKMSANQDVPPPLPTPDLVATVKKNVLKALGRPTGFHSISCVNVFNNNFRVNVFCMIGDGRAVFPAIRITQSFFVKIDGNGEILASEPSIHKEYD